jgi:hypothetical protein
MILLIGSMALKLLYPEARSSGFDIDIIASVEDFVKYTKHLSNEHGEVLKVQYTEDASKVFAFFADKMILECEIAWPGSLGEDLIAYNNTHEEQERHVLGLGADYLCVRNPGLNFLYMLKMSHRYKKNSPHFLKTMRDIQFMRCMGAEILGDLKSLYKKRMKATYNYKHPKKDFFTDDVKYVYDHDSIHRAIAFLDKPAYTYVKECQDEVHMKKANFFASPYMAQILCVLEESMVLALERSIVPFDSFNNPERITGAFKMALFKVCSSITSGWFREFAWEHYDEVMGLFEKDQHRFVKRFQKGLDNGTVLPYTVPNY